MADLTAGFLLAAGVLAALVRARETGVGEQVEVSLLAAALAVQLQDLVWLEGEVPAAPVPASRGALEARAAEIGGGVAMNPYYRAYATRDGFVAVACLNVGQRRALLGVFGLDDPTVDAPDLVPADAGALAAKQALTAEIERLFADGTSAEWVERLRFESVPVGHVQMREGVVADPQVEAAGLVSQVEQPGLGTISLLAPFLAVGGERHRALAAPALGADTEAVLGELA